jgi:hypothetical protein
MVSLTPRVFKRALRISSAEVIRNKNNNQSSQRTISRNVPRFCYSVDVVEKAITGFIRQMSDGDVSEYSQAAHVLDPNLPPRQHLPYGLVLTKVHKAVVESN